MQGLSECYMCEHLFVLFCLFGSAPTLCHSIKSCKGSVVCPIDNFPNFRYSIFKPKTRLSLSSVIWGQSYKDFYTSGQIYKCVLKHENNALAQTFVGCNVRAQHPNIFAGSHFSLTFTQQFRLFILHRPKV